MKLEQLLKQHVKPLNKDFILYVFLVVEKIDCINTNRLKIDVKNFDTGQETATLLEDRIISCKPR